MSDTLSLRLPRDLNERLNRLAETTARPKSYYVRKLIEEHLGEIEYIAGLDSQAESIRRAEIATQSLDDLTSDLGFDPEILRAEAQKNIKG